MRSFEPGLRNLTRLFLSAVGQMLHELPANQFRVGRGDCFVDFAFRHPTDPHRVPSCGQCAVAAAGDLHEILPLIRLAEMGFAFVEGVNLGVFLVGRGCDREAGLKEPMAKDS